MNLNQRGFPPKAAGFSLVELLLVLAIIGILAGIAVPAFLGQRRRARIIGDAKSNAETLRAALETRKAENGIYGTISGSYNWTASGGGNGATLIPGFSAKGNSKMNFNLLLTSTGLGYTILVTDPSQANAKVIQTNQAGQQLTGSGVVGPTPYQLR